MRTKTEIYRKLPQEIKTVLLASEGWLVGGACKDIITGDIPKDYDIIVDDINKIGMTNKVLMEMSDGVKLNNYGGLKYSLKSGRSVDIWCEGLSHYLLNANEVSFLFNLYRAILLENI